MAYANWARYVRAQAPTELLPPDWIAPRRLEQQWRHAKTAMSFGELQKIINADPWGALDKNKKVIKAPVLLAGAISSDNARPALDPVQLAALEESARMAAKRFDEERERMALPQPIGKMMPSWQDDF